MAKKNRTKITDSEWEIMRILWDEAPARARDILERLPASTSWSPKTVNTFLARLVEKGAVRVKKEGRIHFYSPAVSQNVCVKVEATAFLDRVFRGDAAPMMMHFLQHEKLSSADVARIREMLDKAEEAGK